MKKFPLLVMLVCSFVAVSHAYPPMQNPVEAFAHVIDIEKSVLMLESGTEGGPTEIAIKEGPLANLRVGQAVHLCCSRAVGRRAASEESWTTAKP